MSDKTGGAAYQAIELECRAAFDSTDGYGSPETDNARYRCFRDGFYVGRMSAQSNEAAAIEHLKLLVSALDSATISSWQSTAAWQNELDDAICFIDALDFIAERDRRVRG